MTSHEPSNEDLMASLDRALAGVSQLIAGVDAGLVKSRRLVCPLGPPQSLRHAVVGHRSSSDKPRTRKQSRRDCGGPSE